MNKEEFENILNIHEEKNQKKWLLESFTFTKKNIFEGSADSVINQLLKDKKTDKDLYRKIWEERDEYFSKKEYNEEKDINDFQFNLHQITVDEYYRNEELCSLVEMKIIYLYKFFEINLKSLLRLSFSIIDTKEFFRWESVIIFLKRNNIDPKKLKSYKEVFELKEVNNSIKHSDSFNENLKNRIPEFKNIKDVTYKELQDFYLRVRKAPISFLSELSNEIQKELYEFDEEKISNLADEIILRMGTEEAKSYVEKIKKAFAI